MVLDQEIKVPMFLHIDAEGHLSTQNAANFFRTKFSDFNSLIFYSSFSFFGKKVGKYVPVHNFFFILKFTDPHPIFLPNTVSTYPL